MTNVTTPSPAKSSTAPKEVREATTPTFRKKYGHAVVSTWPKTVNAGTDQVRSTWSTTVAREYRVGTESKPKHGALFPEDLLHAGIGLILRWVELENAKQTKESSDAK